MDLFQQTDATIPLAEQMRPTDWTDFVGQTHLVQKDTLLRKMIDEDRLNSLILWGPPGCGKTTLAHIISQKTQSRFLPFSAVLAKIAEVKKVMQEAEHFFQMYGQRTLLFIDEIHHFNKSQQDAFLHYLEKGIIILIGATTENPSFELNSAILSRSMVFVLQALKQDELVQILENTLRSSSWNQKSLQAEPELLQAIAQFANGDARQALNILEMIVRNHTGSQLTMDDFAQLQIERKQHYDKNGEEHYNCISAFHKSLRGSDTQATLYWLARMLEAGENPLYIARRMVRFASEDIGLSEPQALIVANAAREAVEFLGMPEANTALAQAAIFLASSPKSNAVYSAYKQAAQTARETNALPVPLHLRNAPTQLMKKLGYGKDYLYPHDFPNAVAPQTYLPPEIAQTTFYAPSQYGFEKDIQKRIQYWERLQKEAQKESSS